MLLGSGALYHINSPNDETMNTQSETLQRAPAQIQSWINWLVIIVAVYVLLVAVGTIGDGFKLATGGKEGAEKIFAFAQNPFVGVIVGLLATALVQSSSTVTSVIVGLVAGGLPVSIAIPMVMGANMGTTVTNTLVSLGHIGNRREFRRAFAAATVHDWFNLLSIFIFLPLEIFTGFLEKLSYTLASLFSSSSSMSMSGINFMKAATKPAVGFLKSPFSELPSFWGGVLVAILGVVLIFVAITVLAKVLRRSMVGRAKEIMHGAIGRGPVSGILSGTAVTVLVQSSSTTTSLMVPLAGSGVFSLRDIYPFTLGANIGTCITAILAATAVPENAGLALQIALAHFLFNLIGVVVIFGIPFLRELPLKAAEWLARIGSEHKLYAVAYVVSIFFLIPGMLAFAASR